MARLSDYARSCLSPPLLIICASARIASSFSSSTWSVLKVPKESGKVLTLRSMLSKACNASASLNFPAPRPCSLNFHAARAVLATHQHALTIQDASEPFWKLAGSQLFVLSSPDGQVFGFHMSKPGWDASLAEADLKKSIEQGDGASWWYGNDQLYRVFLHAIFTGNGTNQRQVGIIAVGYQIDSIVAEQLSLASGSQIALATGDKMIASTLSPAEEKELQSKMRPDWDTAPGSRELLLGANSYRAATALFPAKPYCQREVLCA